MKSEAKYLNPSVNMRLHTPKYTVAVAILGLTMEGISCIPCLWENMICCGRFHEPTLLTTYTTWPPANTAKMGTK